jgi:hypothetical protein
LLIAIIPNNPIHQTPGCVTATVINSIVSSGVYLLKPSSNWAVHLSARITKTDNRQEACHLYKKLQRVFSRPFSLDPPWSIPRENDAEQGSPRWTEAAGVRARKWTEEATNLIHPEKDELQETVDSTANTIKLTLPGKVELRVSVWSHGTPEQFIMHIQQAVNAIDE